jgi:CDP-diacylglycerol--serine O-phosphatidyltransferase
MVSRLPVFSGKMLGGRIAPDMVLPVVVLVVLFIAVLISYPWHLLTFGSIIYLLSLPIGWSSYRAHERRAREAAGATATGNAEPAAKSEFNVAAQPAEDERPPRLN